MADFKIDEALTKTILTKRSQSIPLTDVEENYSRQLFNHMMSSKKTVQKTVRIVTGTDIRKGVDAEATREYNFPRQVGTKPENDNPMAHPDESLKNGEKLPDVDNKPKTTTTEEQALSDKIQVDVHHPTNAANRIPVTTEPAAKFVSADPVVVGDLVSKNFARTGQHVLKGQVIAIDSSGRAIVKWQGGIQTSEWAHTLVKTHTVPAESVKHEDMTSEVPVHGKTATEESSPAIPVKKAADSDPKAEEVRKDGDIFPTSNGPVPADCTPFQDLVCSLERVVCLAGEMKAAAERNSIDPEVAGYYHKMVDQLRGMAEDILGALSMELRESQGIEE